MCMKDNFTLRVRLLGDRIDDRSFILVDSSKHRWLSEFFTETEPFETDEERRHSYLASGVGLQKSHREARQFHMFFHRFSVCLAGGVLRGGPQSGVERALAGSRPGNEWRGRALRGAPRSSGGLHILTSNARSPRLLRIGRRSSSRRDIWILVLFSNKCFKF